jgi:hypothetical protein
MAVRLDQGTKEYVNYLVDDTTNIVTTLVGSSAQFDVTTDVGGAKITNQACVIGGDGMLLQCLVDTNAGGLWTKGLYYLYLHWVIGSETPREGPFEVFIV